MINFNKIKTHTHTAMLANPINSQTFVCMNHTCTVHSPWTGQSGEAQTTKPSSNNYFPIKWPSLVCVHFRYCIARLGSARLGYSSRHVCTFWPWERLEKNIPSLSPGSGSFTFGQILDQGWWRWYKREGKNLFVYWQFTIFDANSDNRAMLMVFSDTVCHVGRITFFSF